MRAGPLNTTDTISSLLLVILQVCVPQPISSSLMSRYVLSAEDLKCFQPSKMKKCEVDFEERRIQ